MEEYRKRDQQGQGERRGAEDLRSKNPQFLSPHGRDIKGCPLLLYKCSFSKKQKKDIVLLTAILKIVSNEVPI
jgi:hypothetical protein